MKIQNNSAAYPDYSIEQLNEELNGLNQAKQIATATGTGTGGVDNLIQKLTAEISRRSGGTSTDNPETIAQQKAELLMRKIDPQYTGAFAIREIPGLGYYAWQEVRGGGSIIVGNDGGILFFNSSVNPEAAIQAYKEGKRTFRG